MLLNSSEMVAAKAALDGASFIAEVNRVEFDRRRSNITSLESRAQSLTEARVAEEDMVLKLEEALRIARENVVKLKAEEYIAVSALNFEKNIEEVNQLVN
jgi:hypothetical protein